MFCALLFGRICVVFTMCKIWALVRCFYSAAHFLRLSRTYFEFTFFLSQRPARCKQQIMTKMLLIKNHSEKSCEHTALQTLI